MSDATLGHDHSGHDHAGHHHDHDHDAVLRDALARVPVPELKAALDQAIRPEYQPPKAVRNACLALRRHHDPVPYLGRPQYRPVIPYLAAVLSDTCLNRTIEVLGDHSEDPTRHQLVDALATVHDEFSDPVVAVMLAAVASDELPSSELCADLLATDPRYGLGAGTPETSAAEVSGDTGDAGPDAVPAADGRARPDGGEPA
jgi:hypothetical protein